MKSSFVFGLILLSLSAVTHAETAPVVDYLQICSFGPAGYYLIPGTNATCLSEVTGQTITQQDNGSITPGESWLAYRIAQLENQIASLMEEENETAQDDIT